MSIWLNTIQFSLKTKTTKCPIMHENTLHALTYVNMMQ